MVLVDVSALHSNLMGLRYELDTTSLGRDPIVLRQCYSIGCANPRLA